MDIGFDAGRVQEASLPIQRSTQAQFLWVEVSLWGELIDKPAHRSLIAPLRVALQRALGRHLNPIQFVHTAEVLKQRAVRQANGKTAKIFHDQSACDITAQGATRMDLNLALSFGRYVFEVGAGLPLFEAVGNELRFQSAVEEQLIDPEKLLAQAPVIDIAFDGGQRRPEELLNGQKSGWHEARL